MATPQAVKNLQTTSTVLKRTAAMQKIGKLLFSKDALNLNPTAIATLLKAAGVPVSKEMTVSLDVAQMVISGGAFINNVERASSISSYMLPGAQAIQALEDILITTGLMDPNSPAAQVMTLGTDIAIVAATGGLNVIADIKLIIDVIQQAMIGQAIADGVAQSNINDMVRARKQSQNSSLARTFAAYQSNQINMFDVLELVATESPDYFSNYFPQYGYFLPDTWVSLYAEGSHTDIFGTHTSHSQTWVNSLLEKDPATIQKLLFENLMLPNLRQFKTLSDNENAQNKISVQSLALLSLLPPYISIFPQNFQALDVMKTLGITPDDLGEPFLDKYLESKKYKENYTAPITLNGVDYFTSKQKTHMTFDASEQRLINADLRGDIGALVKDKDVLPHLIDWGKPDWTMNLIPRTGQNANVKIFSKLISNEMTSMQVRCFRNYWSALDLVKKISGDRYFPSIQSEISQFGKLGDIDQIEKLHKDLLFKVQARALNRQAFQNIAFFMNTQPSNLKILNLHEPGKPALFDYIK